MNAFRSSKQKKKKGNRKLFNANSSHSIQSIDFFYHRRHGRVGEMKANFCKFSRMFVMICSIFNFAELKAFQQTELSRKFPSDKILSLEFPNALDARRRNTKLVCTRKCLKLQ